MSHRKDAVTEWNNEYYQYGKRSDEVRGFMQDPDVYYVETEHANKRDGAKLKEQYRDAEDPSKTDKKKKDVSDDGKC